MLAELKKRIAQWLKRRHGYRALFRDNPVGREVLADMCRRYHVLTVTAVTGDPQAGAFRDGQRSVVLEILQTAGMSRAEITAEVFKLAGLEPPANTEGDDDDEV